MDVVVLSLDECPRTPVLALRDALRDALHGAELVTARSDADIDEAIKTQARLVVAAAADGQLRAVVRRLIRGYLHRGPSRPVGLADDRTVPDLPPLGILPLKTGGLVEQLGLPTEPAAVAKAVLDGAVRRLDLLRTDSGSVTLDGALLGGTGDDGRAVRWYGRVEVDDAVLSDGTDPLIACAIANGTGYSTVDGLPLAPRADPADGVIDVAVAVPVAKRRRVEIQVRRARGRAVSIAPRDAVPLLDDGVAGMLDRKRSWWIERGAWAVYSS